MKPSKQIRLGYCKEKLLINLDSCVDLAYKEVGSVESNGARQEPKGEHHEGRVTKVEQCWNESGNVELSEEVENGVGKHVDCRTT